MSLRAPLGNCEQMRRRTEIHFIAPQAHLPSIAETLSKASPPMNDWNLWRRFSDRVFGSRNRSLLERAQQHEGLALCMRAGSRSSNYEIHEFQAIFWNHGCFRKCLEIEIFAEP